MASADPAPCKLQLQCWHISITRVVCAWEVHRVYQGVCSILEQKLMKWMCSLGTLPRQILTGDIHISSEMRLRWKRPQVVKTEVSFVRLFKSSSAIALCLVCHCLVYEPDRGSRDFAAVSSSHNCSSNSPRFRETLTEIQSYPEYRSQGIHSRKRIKQGDN